MLISDMLKCDCILESLKYGVFTMILLGYHYLMFSLAQFRYQMPSILILTYIFVINEVAYFSLSVGILL